MVTVERLCSDDHRSLDALARLRVRVWEAEGVLREGISTDGKWLDELDSEAIHWVARVNREVVGAARLTVHHSPSALPHPEEFEPYDMAVLPPYGFLSRLVVSRGHRRRGIATLLDRVRMVEAHRLQLTSVVILPTPHRVPALKRNGFRHLGPSGVSADDMPDLRMQMHVMNRPVAGLQPLTPLSGMNVVSPGVERVVLAVVG